MYQWRPLLRSFGPELYSGTSGIGIVLASLARADAEPLVRATAQGAMEQALSTLETIPPEARAGFYSGWSGIACALVECGEMLGVPGWTRRGIELMESVCRSSISPEALDVMSGRAGIIPALLRLYQGHPRDWMIETAVRYGHELIGAAHRGERGWSWRTLPTGGIEGQKDLTGLSHGAAGIAWALLELHAETGEREFLSAAEEAIRYEQSYFDAAQQNWPDFREFPGVMPQPGLCSTTWCHGAPGIGLTRLRAFQITGKVAYREQAEAALRTTARLLKAAAPGHESLCLCHGSFGNAETLLLAAEVWNDNALRREADAVGRRSLETYINRGLPLPCGVNGGEETPGLMLGIAGMAYFLLRLAGDARLPSWLLYRPEARVAAQA